jgi:hypothetical protein
MLCVACLLDLKFYHQLPGCPAWQPRLIIENDTGGDLRALSFRYGQDRFEWNWVHRGESITCPFTVKPGVPISVTFEPDVGGWRNHTCGYSNDPWVSDGLIPIAERQRSDLTLVLLPFPEGCDMRISNPTP